MTFKEFVQTSTFSPPESPRLTKFARKCLSDAGFPQDPLCWPEIETYLTEGQENRFTISSAFCFWWCFRQDQMLGQ